MVSNQIIKFSEAGNAAGIVPVYILLSLLMASRESRALMPRVFPLAQAVVVQLLQHRGRALRLQGLIVQLCGDVGLHLGHAAPVPVAVYRIVLGVPASRIEAAGNSVTLVRELHVPVASVRLEDELPVPAFGNVDTVGLPGHQAHLLYAGHDRSHVLYMTGDYSLL